MMQLFCKFSLERDPLAHVLDVSALIHHLDVKILISSWGWLGGAKMLCILHHGGVQLILAYSWARPAILVVGKGRGGMFLFLLFLHFHSCSSFFPVGVVGWCEGAVYLTSLGRPTDIGLQLGKACYPCSG